MSDCLTCVQLHRIWAELLNTTFKCIVSASGSGLDILNSITSSEDCEDGGGGGGGDEEDTSFYGLYVGVGAGVVGLGLLGAGMGWGFRRWWIRKQYQRMEEEEGEGVEVRFHPIEGFEMRQIREVPPPAIPVPLPNNYPENIVLDVDVDDDDDDDDDDNIMQEQSTGGTSALGRKRVQRQFYQAGTPR